MLTTYEVAKLLGVTPTTIRRWADSGEIPSFRIGNRYRFSRRKLNQWMKDKDIHLVEELEQDESKKGIDQC